MIEIARAEGAWLYTADGRRILDAISSWWVITHGHGHPAIAAAIAEQARTLEQVIFAGFTHRPAETAWRASCWRWRRKPTASTRWSSSFSRTPVRPLSKSE